MWAVYAGHGERSRGMSRLWLSSFPSPGGRGERGQHHHRDISSRCTFSAVIGRSLMRTPTASATALAMAGAGGPMGVSPNPFALYGPRPLSDAQLPTLSLGISRMLGLF